MIINVHAGHCPDGKGASGAVGILKESTENRRVKDEVVRLLKLAGHTVYDCTCDTAETKSGCLKAIVSKCNAHKADFDLSIHFNDGVTDRNGNGTQTGTECWATNYSAIKGQFAERYLAGMKNLGFRIHGEGKKTTSGLYVLNNTHAPAVLIEVCFVGDKDDVDAYNRAGYKAVARVIAEAIHGKAIAAKGSATNTERFSVGLRPVKNGSTGSHVRALQILLNGNGCTDADGKKLTIDGQAGAKTVYAVKMYQRAHGLADDGEAGLKTWHSILGVV